MTSEPFAVAWAPSARRDIARLPEKVAAAAIEFVYGSLAAAPYRVGHELRLDLAGHHSARRGDFRIVYRITEVSRVVEIVAIQHRADVYRPQGRRS